VGLATEINEAVKQPTGNCEPATVVSVALGWQVQWPVTGGRISVFILVLVKGSVLKLLALKFCNAP